MKDEGFCVFGALAIARQLQALQAEMEGVRAAEDIEFVHRMRVASRRLRAALPLFTDCFPAKSYKNWFADVRGITRALGAARDTDVQIERLEKFMASAEASQQFGGLRRLVLRLRQARTRYQEEVLSALSDIDQHHTIADMDQRMSSLVARKDQVYLYTPYLYLRAYEALTGRMNEFLAYEPYITQPDRVAELHAMRIAAKRLRYTLEIFASIYPGEMKAALQAIRKVQESLGEIHDCDVWISYLPEFLEKERLLTLEFYGSLRNYRRIVPGIQAFLEERISARNREYQDFLRLWNKVSGQNTWSDVLATIRIPFFRGDTPPAGSPQPAPAREESPG